jgi:hypothetical protein
MPPRTRSRDMIFASRLAVSAAITTALLSVGGALAPAPASAQWSTAYEQFYLPGKFNWQFRHNYAGADRLFNGFDFGHAILYETFWTKPDAPPSELEEKWYNRLTKEILVHPPRVPLEEAAIEVAYAKLAPEAKLMFDWAHLFHRQVYDVWADERIPPAEKDAKVAELLRYYKTRPDLAFSSHPKTMELMEGQPYSLTFRKNYPKFNGLIWAYHWLQVGLYEPLVVGRNKAERQTGVTAAVSRFWQMIEDPPTNMPRIMPMTAAVAPTFAARYPEASIIFDNLHAMHDVVSDILANPMVPRDRKREEIMRAARRFRDDTSYVMTVAEWRDMAKMMGVENMGGPSVGFLADFPRPTVERGAVMAGMDHSQMAGMRDSAGMRGMDHGKMAGADSAKAGAMQAGQMQHGQMSMAPGQAMPGMGSDSGAMRTMMELHMRMLADPVIRTRLMADTAIRRMMTEMMDDMPAEHRQEMQDMLDRPARAEVPPPAARPRGRAKPTPAKPAAAKPTPPKTTPAKPTPAKPEPAKPADPHAGHPPPRR